MPFTIHIGLIEANSRRLNYHIISNIYEHISEVSLAWLPTIIQFYAQT